jgi:hypothetical protein
LRAFTFLAALCVAGVYVAGPVSAADAPDAAAPPATTATTGTITGVVKDSSGAPVNAANVAASGPSPTSAKTDPEGDFTLTLSPGVYTLTITKAGFSSATSAGYAVVAGTSQNLDITLSQISFESIKEIAHVSVSANSGFNTSASSVASISQQAFIDQGQLQVQHIFDETPGIVSDHPGTSANNASPGDITFPSIRGGLGFETASLIDGHPLAVQDYGDYVTTFISPYVLQDVDVVKGPGAGLSENYYAVNGAVNFHTLEPTHALVASVVQGVDGYGGFNSNYRITDTVLNHKLGFALDYAIDGTPGPLNNSTNFSTLPSTGDSYIGTSSSTGIPVSTTVSAGTTNPNVINNPPSTTSLVYCCENVSTTYSNKTELAKLRYNFSDATAVTFTYLGSQTWTNQNGNHAYNLNLAFVPGAAYATGLAPNGVIAGSTINTYQNAYPFKYSEVNNEPILQGEFRTTFMGDTILARYYAASINRLQYNGNFSDTTVPLQLWGSFTPASGPLSGVTQYYNGQVENVTFPASYALYQNNEADTLHGGSLEYDHYFGSTGNVLRLSYDETDVRSNTYSVFDDATTAAPNTPILDYSYSVFPGSAVHYRTYRATVNLLPLPNVDVVLSNYLDSYTQRTTENGGSTWLQDGHVQDDPRLDISWRATPDVSVRAMTGASIAPPYLSLLDNGFPSYTISSTGAYVSTTQQTGQLKPETAFGYDLGADLRVSGDKLTVISTDLYLNNVKNQLVSAATFQNGTITYCVPSSGSKITSFPPCSGGAATATLPLIESAATNLNNARYQGIELAVKRDPHAGFGFVAQGAVLNGYPYGVSPCLYSKTIVAGGTTKDCTVANTNLAILPGINYLGTGTAGTNGTPTNGAGTNYNSVSNTAIPYAQAYAELHYRTVRGGYLGFGLQYLGANNSYNEPAFFIGNASARLPLPAGVFLQASVYNLFNAYPNATETEAAGVAVPLANGQTGLTNANVVGPRYFLFTLSKTFSD